MKKEGARGGTSCDDLHWDGQSVCQRSWACVAPQAVLSTSTFAWSRPAPRMLAIVCSLCQRFAEGTLVVCGV